MRDCPRPQCQALRSVDSEGYCSCCARIVVRPPKLHEPPRDVSGSYGGPDEG